MTYMDGPFSPGEMEDRRHRPTKRSSSERPLAPTDLYTIYDLTGSATDGAGKTIGIVDAFGASTAESDLAYFSSYWGLPACTTANGCFRKVNSTGGTHYPADDTSADSWSFEVALDIQSAHSVAPGANILLVVATSSSTSDQFAAVEYAVAHADYISMSWGGVEWNGVTEYDSYYFATTEALSKSIFASTGDNGEPSTGVLFPASSPHVTAVGGTSTFLNSDGSFAQEKGWSGSGGGCSAYFAATAAQQASNDYSALGCNGAKALPDVAMNADPNSGLYIWMSQSQFCTPPACWWVFGGTSLASPIFAARAAISGEQVDNAFVYGGQIQYRDVTQGSDGEFSCTAGLDLVTGQGTWIGMNDK